MSHGYIRQDFRALLDEMILSAGTWALVAVNVTPQAADTWKKRGCETTSRKNNTGKYDIYARWSESKLMKVSQ